MNRTMRGHSRYGTVKAHQIVCKFYKWNVIACLIVGWLDNDINITSHSSLPLINSITV